MMKNASLKLPLLIFILVITSNLGAEARKLTGVADVIVEGEAASPQYGIIDENDTLNKAPSCKRDIDYIGSEARELTGAGKKLEVATRSSNYAGTARTLLQARPCQRDVDCNFQCPRIQGGQCNNHHGTCDCF
ncbi:unnamed protein product [Arabidopsis thaliana]|uniref:(thale cress) hypothetical protein n=1 Tax=Arabidopsis thaliana TaxID=3702 RepID=A0A7G2EKZ0_ARATH|nr:unnamed protein product [Arabidopsis thaliana]